MNIDSTQQMDVRYHFGVDEESQNSKKSRTTLVSCACTFCKKRHLKCDGQLPCSNCVAKKVEDQCCYPQQAKRGRKPGPPQGGSSTDLAAYKYSNTYQNVPTPQTAQNSKDASLLMELIKLRQEAEFWKQQYFREHEKCIAIQLQSNVPKVMESSIQLMQLSASIFFRSAASKLSALLPFYVSVVDSDFPWHHFKGIRCDNYRRGLINAEELCNALEYASICAIGSLEHNHETSIEFANKAEDLLYVLFWKEMIHYNEKLAARAFKVVLMYICYWWCNLNPLKAQLISQLALLMWQCNKHIFPPLWCYQLFGALATSSKTFEERLRWVTSMKTAMDQMSEPAEPLTCLQMAFATSLSLVRFSAPGSLTDVEKQTLLQFMELLNGTYCSKWVVSERSMMVLAACKSIVFYHLGNHQSSLEFCRETLQRVNAERIDMASLLALSAARKVLKTITGQDISQEHLALLEKYQTQYPVLRDLMNQFKGIPPEFMKTISMTPSHALPPPQPDPWCEPMEPAESRISVYESDSSSSPEQIDPFTDPSSSSSCCLESPPSLQDWQFLLTALSQNERVS